jgi:hypothetical protein
MKTIALDGIFTISKPYLKLLSLFGHGKQLTSEYKGILRTSDIGINKFLRMV